MEGYGFATALSWKLAWAQVWLITQHRSYYLSVIHVHLPCACQVVVRHGPVMEARLCAALTSCPPAVWQAVTPQLFAQLSHPQPAVRRLVLGVLHAVAMVSRLTFLSRCVDKSWI